MFILVGQSEKRLAVYVEPRGQEIFENLTREDNEYVRLTLTKCVTTLVDKYEAMYGKRS